VRPVKSKGKVASHAAELHREAIVIDCHSDILMPIADGFARLGKQVPVPDPRAWRPPFEMPDCPPIGESDWPRSGDYGCLGQYSLPQFLAGGLTAQVCAVFVRDQELHAALRRCMEMIWWFHREVEDNEAFELVTKAGDIRRAKRRGTCGGILALEGAEPLGHDVKLLDLFHKLGVRMAGLAHNRRNMFSDGTQHGLTTGGLTPLGKRAIARMNELGIVVDVGHLDALGFWEALEASKAPVVLSHRSPRKFFPLQPADSPFCNSYDLSRGRERLEALARNGGVFGVFFLKATDADDVVADVEYMMDLVGPDHVGLGSDLYGLPGAPKGVEDISKIPVLTERMVRRGHCDQTILKFLGGNFLRVFEKVWAG
jgi:membrane dipeptidase